MSLLKRQLGKYKNAGLRKSFFFLFPFSRCTEARLPPGRIRYKRGGRGSLAVSIFSESVFRYCFSVPVITFSGCVFGGGFADRVLLIG